MVKLSGQAITNQKPEVLDWVAGLTTTGTNFGTVNPVAISTGLGSRTDAIMRIWGVEWAHDRLTSASDFFIGLYSSTTNLNTDFRNRTFVLGFESMGLGNFGNGFSMLENQYHTHFDFFSIPILYAEPNLYLVAISGTSGQNAQARIYFDIIEVDATVFYRVLGLYR